MNFKQKTVFFFWVALLMSFFITFTATAINVGFNQAFIKEMLQGWLITFVSAFIIAFPVVPVIEKLTFLIVKKGENHEQTTSNSV